MMNKNKTSLIKKPVLALITTLILSLWSLSIYALTQVNSSTSCSNIGSGENWSGLGNTGSSNNSYASVWLNDWDESEYLGCTDFGFSIPVTATINGITVRIERRADISGRVRDYSLQLMQSGNLGGSDYADRSTYYSNSDSYVSYGDASNLWGRSWTPAQINAANFGIGLKSRKEHNGNGWMLTHVDHIEITVDYTEAASPPASPTVNTLSTSNSTPTITGTFDSSDAGGGFIVTVNSVNYPLSGSDLNNSGDDWSLAIPTALSAGTYEVTATATNSSGLSATDTSSNELTITGSIWDSYSYSEQLSITTGPNAPDKRYDGYTVRLESFDTQSLISAGKMQSDCDDLRVVKDNSGTLVEVDRHLFDCNTASSDIRFMLQADIADSSSDTTYYLYYGNPSASAPNAVTTTNVYRWYDDASINRLGSYTRGRVDAWHGSGWDDSMSWNAAGYYTYNNGDNYTSGYRIAVDERDALMEAEFYHTGCYPTNMTSGVLLRGQIDSGTNGSESSSHYYATNRGHNSSCGGGYSQDGDIIKSFRTTVAIDGTNPASITNSQWRKMALSAWGINATSLNFWDSNNGWPALAWPDTGSLHVTGTDSDYDGRGFAAIMTAQDRARVRNIVVRRYVEPEPIVVIPSPAGGACSAEFPSSLQNTDAPDSITFGWNSQVFNEPDNQLETYNLTFNTFAASTCATDNVDCTAANQNSSKATLTAFENSTGSTNINTNATGNTFALGSDSNADYRQISVGDSDTLTDSGYATTYHISRLTLHSNSSWTIQGGSDYWIETFTPNSNATISVSGSGTARLFIRDSVSFVSPPNINPLGSAQDLFIVGYGDIAINSAGTQNNALIYAQGDVTIGDSTHITGAIASEGNIVLSSSNSKVTYDSSAVTNVDHRGLCNAGSTPVDHYSISYPLGNPGLTCEANAVTITAHDASDTTMAPSVGTQITLSTSIANDGWTLKSGNGTFSAPDQYTFDGSETSAEFWLRKTTATTSPHMDIDVTDGTATDSDGHASEDVNAEFADSGFRFFDSASSTAESINHQIAGKPSSTAPNNQTLQLRAVQTDTATQACEAALQGITAVELAYECNNPSTCTGSDLVTISAAENKVIARNNNTAGSIGSYTSVNMLFDVNGIAPFSFYYNDAGQIQLHARKILATDDSTTPPTAAATLLGASNQFVVRPFGFYMNNLTTATDATSANIFAKAGDSFTTSLSAKIWVSGEDADSDGIPDNQDDLSDNLTTANFGNESSAQIVSLTHSKVRPTGAGTSSGSLSGDTSRAAGGSGSAFSSGTASPVTLGWDEVGIIDLNAFLNDYLGSGQNTSSTKTNVGRFIPHHFDISNNTPGFADSCTLFTYLDQPFYYNTAPLLTVTAKASGGTTTLNYGGGNSGANGFWKLNSSLLRNFADGSAVSPSATLSVTTAGAITLAGESDFDGIGTLSQENGITGDSFTYSKNMAEIPFNADVDITYTAATLTDSDSACYDPDNDLTCDSYAITISDASSVTTQLRYGRMSLIDAYGSELNPLNIPLNLEYWDTIAGNSTYYVNTDDTCTILNSADVILSEYSGNLNSGETSVTAVNLSGGKGNITLSAPGNNNDGSLCIEYDLSSGSSLDQSWLQQSWDCKTRSSNNPLSNGRFGIYPGNSRQIYMREQY